MKIDHTARSPRCQRLRLEIEWPVALSFVCAGLLILPSTRASTLAVLSDRPQSTASIETRVDLSRTRLEMLLKVLDAVGMGFDS